MAQSRERTAEGPRGATEAAQPYDVGSRSQVFVDRTLVGAAKGVMFTLHPAQEHPVGPWLDHVKDRPRPAGPIVLYDA